MTDFLKSALRRHHREWRGAPQRRSNAAAEDIANPSRVLSLLQQRGLIERDAARGPGASARLTDTGRIIGQQAIEEMQQA